MKPSRLAAVLLAAGLCLGSQAHADTPEVPHPATDGGKSPWLAATLAGGAALVGYGTAAGLAKGSDGEPVPVTAAFLTLGFFGPAAGHIYVGRNAHHALGFAFARVGFAALGFLGVGDLMSHDSFQARNGETQGTANKPLDYTLIGLAVAGVLGATVWETVDSYSCAQLTHGPQRTLALSPFLLPSATGAFASGGVVLSGSI